MLAVFIFIYTFIIIFFFGVLISWKGTAVLILVHLFLALYIVCELCIELLGGGYLFHVYEVGIYFSNFYYFDISWNFLIDSISLIMMFVVISISLLVHCYSIFYMQYDPHFYKFIGLLSLFTSCMLILVTASNLIQLFIGWEGVGICSYLLINFWSTRIQANKAANKAMLMNRSGDISLLLFISIYFYIFKTFDYSLAYLLFDSYKYAYINFSFFDIHLLSLLCFFLIIAVVGKSAQLGLHTWLPDAMEGPTPVSASIHAATMVTAGVFILIKFSILVDLSFLKNFLLIVGALTAFFASLVATVQNDIKKVIAYSTCSQLGYMVVACGLGHYDLALFHLFNHAFFKASLFSSAGIVLHSLYDEQDMRLMGGLVNLMPYTYISICIASYALMGLPFSSGFHPKDVILEIIYSYNGFLSLLLLLLLLFAAFFTAYYSFRLVYMVFLGRPNGYFVYYRHIHDCNFGYFLILSILVSCSIFIGYFFKDFFIGVGSYNFYVSANLIDLHNNLFNYEFLSYNIKLFPFFASVGGLSVGYLLYNNIVNFINNSYIKRIYLFIVNKWYFDYIYNIYIANYILNFAYIVTYQISDKGLYEIIGVNMLYKTSHIIFYYYNKLYNSYLSIYLMLFSISLIFLSSYIYINILLIEIFNFSIIYGIFIYIYIYTIKIIPTKNEQ